jgi:hypothetical protein
MLLDEEGPYVVRAVPSNWHSLTGERFLCRLHHGRSAVDVLRIRETKQCLREKEAAVVLATCGIQETFI